MIAYVALDGVVQVQAQNSTEVFALLQSSGLMEMVDTDGEPISPQPKRWDKAPTEDSVDKTPVDERGALLEEAKDLGIDVPKRTRTTTLKKMVEDARVNNDVSPESDVDWPEDAATEEQNELPIDEPVVDEIVSLQDVVSLLEKYPNCPKEAVAKISGIIRDTAEKSGYEALKLRDLTDSDRTSAYHRIKEVLNDAQE